jgi:hypothetical protein
MARVVRLDLAPSLSTSERLDAAFTRARELDDGSTLEVAAIVEFSLAGEGGGVMRLDRADLFIHDQTAADVSRDELETLRRWMAVHRDEVMRWRGHVRPKPPNPGETRWSETTRRTPGVSGRPRTVVIEGKDVTVPAGGPVSRSTVRWGRTQGTLPSSEPDRPSA